MTHIRLNPALRRAPRSQQRGFAALLAVLLVGLGLTATTLGTLYSVRGVQDTNLALHQTTQTQAKAWQALEVVRLGLASMTTQSLEALTVGNLTITGLPGISAVVGSNTAQNGGRRLTVQVTATGAGGTASTTVEGVFQVVPGGGGASTTVNNLNGAANISGGLSAGGSVTVLGGSGSSAEFNVIGDVEFKGSINGFEKLCATGNITISSGIEVANVCTNGNLTLEGSASVISEATVKGNVILKGGSADITTITANGDVTVSGGSAHTDTVTTKGHVVVSGGSAYAKQITTEGNVTWSSSNKTPATIRANGDVVFEADSPSTVITSMGDVTLSKNGNVKNITSNGDVDIKSTGGAFGAQGALSATGSLSWNRKDAVAASGTVGGALQSPVGSGIKVSRVSGYSAGVSAVSVPVVNNVFAATPMVDAYALESSANYAFKINAAGQKTVTVKGVSNIEDDTYIIGNYVSVWNVPELAGGNKDYLCKAVNAAGNCTAPTLPYKTLCAGASDYNECFSYNSSSREWKVNGKTMAPGVAWFEGSLEVSNGRYFNTFIATENIETGGNMKSYAVNYAGYAGVCTNQTANGRDTSRHFAGMYPIDYCDTTAGVMTYQALGNAVFIAGSYKDGVFQGGDVSLGANNELFGIVIAGNQLQTTGSTTVHGQVYAAAQGTTTNNDFKGSLTIDLSNLPQATTFNPSEITCMGNCTTSAASSARVFWSRYL